MNTVWKYELFADDYNALKLPKGTKPLTVQVQYGKVCMWCLVNPDEKEIEERVFRIAGTGHYIKEENLNYIGTFQLYDGSFIGHVFEILT